MEICRKYLPNFLTFLEEYSEISGKITDLLHSHMLEDVIL